MTCLIPLLAIVALVGLIAFAIRWQRAIARRRQLDVTRQLSQSVDRLAADPHDRAALEQIGTVTSNASWVPDAPCDSAKDLLNRAIRFAFGNLELQSGQAVAYRILVPLASHDMSQILSAVRQIITDRPTDRHTHEVILSCLRAMQLEQNQRQWLYDRVLDIVQQSPTAVDLSVLALEIGRWHLGRSRADGRVTVYDESAIQNDIAVRRGMA